jgi:hypothetical protein
MHSRKKAPRLPWRITACPVIEDNTTGSQRAWAYVQVPLEPVAELVLKEF